ncbi:Mu-like prophage major head subunit gpT [Cedecea neteri]|uniref:Mu-like prophage major head subunit gpT n=1 Tax=Cedecea neteri TaxID=158822 RepID=A0A2X3JBX1_9ENTR|nr:Mu-like prophage major head subunit gpT [Cedecea neteri]
MTAERLDDGKTNIYKGTAKVLVVPWLTDDDAWFLMDTSRAIKPLIFQQRKKPVFVSQQDMNNPDVFMRKKLKFGAEARIGRFRSVADDSRLHRQGLRP